MPGFDGTGPRGMGPMTGGGRGFCAIPGYGVPWGVPRYGAPWGMPYYGATPPTPSAVPFAPQMTRDQELDFLKAQAQAMRDQLEQIEARVQQLGNET
ncbi:MAG TPA: DUF5320 domain-containing protein [Dehalococcoidia bacterium]|nr:DUF5320 domain-containing protein [Dehalococcoidia bacterium]